jgi:hypothetical protein
VCQLIPIHTSTDLYLLFSTLGTQPPVASLNDARFVPLGTKTGAPLHDVFEELFGRLPRTRRG